MWQRSNAGGLVGQAGDGNNQGIQQWFGVLGLMRVMGIKWVMMPANVAEESGRGQWVQV